MNVGSLYAGDYDLFGNLGSNVIGGNNLARGDNIGDFFRKSVIVYFFPYDRLRRHSGRRRKRYGARGALLSVSFHL